MKIRPLNRIELREIEKMRLLHAILSKPGQEPSFFVPAETGIGRTSGSSYRHIRRRLPFFAAGLKNLFRLPAAQTAFFAKK
jgi:hypothetical protein